MSFFNVEKDIKMSHLFLKRYSYESGVAMPSNSLAPLGAVTKEPWIFDCAAYYAHHEMELGIWQAARHKFSFGGLHMAEYKKEFFGDDYNWDSSCFACEFEDRVRLYSVKTNLMYSVCVPGAQSRVE